MFASDLPRWTASLRRAAALVKAFALLEDAPPSASVAARPCRHADNAPRRLADIPALRATRERREGAVAARPAVCTVPVVRRDAGTRGAAARSARWAAQRAAHR
ncbi:MAG TPA: hypothetical protein VMY78_10165 [Solirubrobacteraceae bacterium]|nr:hypothetical protein [Solirubrobacteraceae bacterium]